MDDILTMVRQKTDEELIRWVERKVLDEKYRQYSILRRPREQAIAHLFKVLGDLQRDISHEPTSGEPFSVTRNIMNYSIEAVSHNLRWLSTPLPTRLELPGVQRDQLDTEGLEFLQWGIYYHMLFTDHVVWSRGLIEAHVNRDEQLITFSYPNDTDYIFLHTQIAALHEMTIAEAESRPKETLSSDFKGWLARNMLRQIGGTAPWRLERSLKSYSAVLEWLNETLWPELPENSLIGSYTLGQFRQFYAALFLFSQFIAWAEDSMDYQFGLENIAGSLIISYPEQELYTWLVEISGLRRRIVRDIVNDLEFKPEDKYSALWYQPFFKTRRKQLFLLGRLVSSLNPSQVLSLNMNSPRKRRVYEGLVQELEQRKLDEVEHFLHANTKWKAFREREFIGNNQNRITPDFVLFDEDDLAVLIVDFKYSLIPHGPVQVMSKISNMVGTQGTGQVQNYLSFFLANHSLLTSLTGSDNHSRKLFGLLLFQWPMPVPLPKDSNVSKIDWFTFRRYLQEHKQPSLLDTLEWINWRPDFGKQEDDFEFSSFEIEVDGWTYKRWFITQK